MKPVLKVQNLEVAFTGKYGDNKIIDQVSFEVKSGETLCIVGESGSGKSVTMLSVMGLLPGNGKIIGGSAEFNGVDILNRPEKELDRIRGSKITMIFQDAMTSLNPVFTIGTQMVEAMRKHWDMDRKTARERAELLLGKVGLPDPAGIMRKYPHTLSGGMRQRVMIAMALSCNPKLIVADEPTTALDVTIQAQIMELIKDLKTELDMAVVLITHDMGLVAEMADRVLVMYAGQIAEEAEVHDLFHHPSHPYTQALLSSIPSITDDEDRVLTSIAGSVPEYYQEITGCRFINRCPYAVDQCAQPQNMVKVEEGHYKRCWLPQQEVEE